MSPPPHREKDAKVEGRDPLETAPKETMAPFRGLMARLLKVKPEEVAEQQRLYDEARDSKPRPLKGIAKKAALATLAPSLRAKSHPPDKQKIPKSTEN